MNDQNTENDPFENSIEIPTPEIPKVDGLTLSFSRGKIRVCVRGRVNVERIAKQLISKYMVENMQKEESHENA
jgi:hypothetical protein